MFLNFKSCKFILLDTQNRTRKNEHKIPLLCMQMSLVASRPVKLSVTQCVLLCHQTLNPLSAVRNQLAEEIGSQLSPKPPMPSVPLLAKIISPPAAPHALFFFIFLYRYKAFMFPVDDQPQLLDRCLRQVQHCLI